MGERQTGEVITMKRTKLRMLAALAAALTLLLGAFSAHAAGLPLNQMGIYDYAMVTGTETLNLRSGPGVEYDWLDSAREGDWIGIRGESGNWYAVYVLSSGKTGYMSKNFLTRTGNNNNASPAAPAVPTGVVNNPRPTSFLNLRQYPSLAAPVLGIFYNGAVFTVLSSTADGWYQVQINGMTGYFRQEFVRVQSQAAGGSQLAYVSAPNGGKVNLRDAPTYLGSSVLSQHPTGTAVSVILNARNGTFWKVSAGGQVGYMDSAFLSTTPVTPVRPAVGPVNPAYPARPATHGTAVVHNPQARQLLNLRAQPTTAARVIAQYGNGVRFEVIEPGETWTKVYGAATGNIGYFMTRYLTLSGVSATPTKQVQNNGSYVNLRSAPNTQSSTVYAQVPSGASVTVLTPGDTWTQVRYNGTEGYMMTAFLR